MTITVVNKFVELNHIYCGRGSALGNPFFMHNENQRDSVCEQYKEWFYQQVDESGFLSFIEDYDVKLNPQMIMLRSIFHKAQEGHVNLGCYCAPRKVSLRYY